MSNSLRCLNFDIFENKYCTKISKSQNMSTHICGNAYDVHVKVYKNGHGGPSLISWTRLFVIFIIKGFRTIVFIFIVISTTFQPIYTPGFFRCMSNSGTFTEYRTTSFIESSGVTCSDSVSHNQVQVLSIPVLLLACSQDWTCNLQMIVSLEA